MQIRKYEARTMAEALSLVKSELGPDAVILSTGNKRRGAGSFGLFGTPMVEITAALDRNPSARMEKRDFYGKPPQTYSSLSAKEMIVGAAVEDGEKLREEIRELKRCIAQMKTKPAAKETKKSAFPAAFEGLYEEMTSTGVMPKLAASLIEKSVINLDRCGGKSGRGKISLAKEALAMEVMSLTRVSGGIKLNGKKGKAVAFVGPTGVGKTTTIAKLAAKYSAIGKDIALITTDTYRIGAAEQFKTYAKILKAPVGIASTPRELKEKILFFRDKDLILIDTAGRSQRDGRQLSFLKELFPHHEETPEVHLLMSATTSSSGISDIIKRFSALPLESYLFTKLDECSDFGPLLNVAARYKVPYSYFTTGQRVPEDLEIAIPERVADLILRIREEVKPGKTESGRK